jgi:hypothetical protein
MKRILAILQTFTALGAIPAGLMFIISPDGSLLGMNIEMISSSPFNSFLIPGIFLFTVNGLGNAAGALLAFSSNRHAGITGLILGVILCTWIIFQLFWLNEVSFLQPALFIVGAATAISGYIVRKTTDNLK